MTAAELIKLLQITHGRIAPREVYLDFLALAAAWISNGFDPVHRDQRAMMEQEVLAKYTPAEQSKLEDLFQQLSAHYQRSLQFGRFHDLLGRAGMELGLAGRNGKNYSPDEVGQLLGRLALPTVSELPKEGFFRVNDPTCGSGTLVITAAEQVADQGYNICQHMVAQAQDIAVSAVHMAYVQLSLYCIPAVVVHGDTITLKEYDRWYTPAYILGNWVWRCPFPFSVGRNKSDELLKMAQEPMYAAIRRMTAIEKHPQAELMAAPEEAR